MRECLNVEGGESVCDRSARGEGEGVGGGVRQGGNEGKK